MCTNLHERIWQTIHSSYMTLIGVHEMHGRGIDALADGCVRTCMYVSAYLAKINAA